VAGSCEYGDEPSGSGATELVSYYYVACNIIPSWHSILTQAYHQGEEQ
jgi:hypothetical protein